MIGRVLFATVCFTAAFSASAQFLIMTGEVEKKSKKLFEESYDVQKFPFELVLSENHFKFEYMLEGRAVTFQNIDSSKSGFCKGCPEIQKDDVVPVPLKMKKPAILWSHFIQPDKDTLLLKNTLPSDLLDSVKWSFEAAPDWMQSEVKAYYAGDYQWDMIRYIISHSGSTLTDSINLNVKEPMHWGIEEKTQSSSDNEKAFGFTQSELDSIYLKLEAVTGIPDKCFIFWYRGCFPCTKMIVELNKEEFLYDQFILINPIDTEEEAKGYLSDRGVHFRNFCLKDLQTLNAYPTCLWPCADETDQTCIIEGYSNEVVEILKAAAME